MGTIMDQLTGDVAAKPGQTTPPADAAQTSEATKDQAPQSYTNEDVKALTQKAVSDALAETGREMKTLKDKIAALSVDAEQVGTLNETIEQLRQRNIAAEIEAAKDNPKAFDLVKRLHEVEEKELQLRNKETELKKEKASWETAKAELTNWQIERNVSNVATANGIDPVVLKKLVPDGDMERLNEAAQVIKTTVGVKTTEQPPAANGGTPPRRADSGVGSGGISSSSVRQMIDKSKKKYTN